MLESGKGRGVGAYTPLCLLATCYYWATTTGSILINDWRGILSEKRLFPTLRWIHILLAVMPAAVAVCSFFLLLLLSTFLPDNFLPCCSWPFHVALSLFGFSCHAHTNLLFLFGSCQLLLGFLGDRKISVWGLLLSWL